MFISKTNKMFPPLIFVTFILLVSGCFTKVRLVAQYDELLDKSVLHIQINTLSTIQSIHQHKGINDGSFEKYSDFHSRTQAEIIALAVRSQELERDLKHQPLTQNLLLLLQQFKDFQTLHQMPYNQNAIDSAEKSLNQSFSSIVKYLVYLKWNDEPAKK